jgi:hypothetical protein
MFIGPAHSSQQQHLCVHDRHETATHLPEPEFADSADFGSSDCRSIGADNRRPAVDLRRQL